MRRGRGVGLTGSDKWWKPGHWAGGGHCRMDRLDGWMESERWSEVASPDVSDTEGYCTPGDSTEGSMNSLVRLPQEREQGRTFVQKQQRTRGTA